MKLPGNYLAVLLPLDSNKYWQYFCKNIRRCPRLMKINRVKLSDSEKFIHTSVFGIKCVQSRVENDNFSLTNDRWFNSSRNQRPDVNIYFQISSSTDEAGFF